MIDLLKLYHQSPYPLRCIAASTRGYYLRFWRYGPQLELSVDTIREREIWSDIDWQNWINKNLSFVLYRAIKSVPYYRDHWNKRRRAGDRSSSEYLENWPVLNKELVRKNPKAFVADDVNTKSMFHEHTSGTTGKSLDLWWSKETVQNWYALFEARWRRWYGISRYDRWAILGGQLIVPVWQRRPPFWVWNAGLNQLYMSSYHLAPNLIPPYLNALKQYRIAYLWGYTSSLYALAMEALRLGIKDLKMAVVITNAEPVFDYQREAIAEAFQCPVRETYGMAEIVAAASECENGRLHLWPEAGIVEVFDGNDPVEAGMVGDLVCTGLANPDMPLIRYRIGDRGALAVPGTACDCGRSLPILASIEGRSDDVLYTMDGRRIGRLDPVFKTNLPVVEAQIIQESLDQIRVRFVPAEDYTNEAGNSIIKRLQDRIGQVNVILEKVEVIPREKNGKFRSVISLLPKRNIQ